MSSTADLDTAVAFLESRGLLDNADLIGLLYGMQSRPEPIRALLCLRADQPAGVMWINDDCRTAQSYVRMDAVDGEAVNALLGSLPEGHEGYYRLHRPHIQRHFGSLTGAAKVHVDINFSVSAAGFAPVAGEEVVEVGQGDAGLFDGCEAWVKGALHRLGEDGLRAFAILRRGRVAASALMGPVIPRGGRDYGIVGIAAVYTEPGHRRARLGKRLVSHMTEIIVQQGGTAVYWTTPDNTASRRLAESLGYRQYGTIEDYTWRKPCTRYTRSKSGT